MRVLSGIPRVGIVVLAIAACGGVVLVGVGYGLPMVLLMIAGGLLVLVIGTLWMSLLKLGGDAEMTLDEALTTALPRAEEERKRAVLRALKDLEYERRMGKVTEGDYAQLSQRYRQEAKALLAALDQAMGPARKAAERRIARRLRKAGVKPATGDVSKKDGSGERASARVKEGASSASRGPTRRCPSCKHRSPLCVDECVACNAALADEGYLLCRVCPAVYPADSTECPTCGVAGGAV